MIKERIGNNREYTMTVTTQDDINNNLVKHIIELKDTVFRMQQYLVNEKIHEEAYHNQRNIIHRTNFCNTNTITCCVEGRADEVVMQLFIQNPDGSVFANAPHTVTCSGNIVTITLNSEYTGYVNIIDINNIVFRGNVDINYSFPSMSSVEIPHG